MVVLLKYGGAEVTARKINVSRVAHCSASFGRYLLVNVLHFYKTGLKG